MKNLFKILTSLCLTTTLILPVISCHSQRPKLANNQGPSEQEIIVEKYYQEKSLQLEKDIQEMSQIVYFNDKDIFDPWNGSIIIDLPYNPDIIIDYTYNKYTYVPLYFENPADGYFDNANLRLTYYFTGQILNILDNKTNDAFSNYLNDFDLYKQYPDYIKYHHWMWNWAGWAQYDENKQRAYWVSDKFENQRIGFWYEVESFEGWPDNRYVGTSNFYTDVLASRRVRTGIYFSPWAIREGIIDEGLIEPNRYILKKGTKLIEDAIKLFTKYFHSSNFVNRWVGGMTIPLFYNLIPDKTRKYDS